MKTVPPHRALAVAALLSLGFFVLPGCSIQVGSSSFHSASIFHGNEGSTLAIELAEWNAAVTDASPIHATWETSGKWLDKISDPAASNLWVQLRFRSRDSTGAEIDYTMHGLRASQFREVHPEASDPGQVNLAADLSTARLLLRGQRGRSKAAGDLEIIPDPVFLQKGGELLEGELTLDELIRFGLQSNPLEYIELVSTNGSHWTWSEVFRLQQRGVNPRFIHALRRQRSTTNVTTAPVSRATPPSREPFSANDLVLLHSRGVAVDFVEKLDAAGTAFTAAELVLLNSRGVSTTYVEKVLSSGLAAEASELVLLHSRGVPAQYIVEIRSAGYNYTASELVLLHSRGVPVKYAENLKGAGYEYASGDVVLLHSRGVPSDYLASIADPGYHTLKASEVLRLYTSGVPSEMVRRLRK